MSCTIKFDAFLLFNDIKSTFALIAPIEYIISKKQFDALL